MNIRSIQGRIEYAFRDVVQPSLLHVKIAHRDCLNVLVVAETFRGIPLSDRFGTLCALYETIGEDITTNFTPVFQAWTPDEWKAINE